MRRLNLLVFDDIVAGVVSGATPPAYSNTDLNELLGRYDSFEIQAVVDNLANTATVTIQLETCSDGRTWVNKNDLPEINNVALGGSGATSVSGSDPGTLGASLGRVRVRIAVSSSIGTIPTAHLKVWIRAGDAIEPFIPTDLPNCFLWLRADRQVKLSSGLTITQWNDSSPSADSNRNLVATGTPQLVVGDANYNGQPTIHLNGTTDYLTSGVWTGTVSPPYTMIVVGHRTSTANTSLFLMPNDADGVDGVYIYADANAPPNTIFANEDVIEFTNAWTVPSMILTEANDPNSAIYLNSVTTVAAPTGSIEPLAWGAGGIIVGSLAVAFGGGFLWPGTIAEIIAYTGILGPSSRSVLRSYIAGRYGLVIT